MDAVFQDGVRRGRLRLLMRLIVLAGAVLALVPIVPWPTAPLVVPALSPYVAIASTLATRSIGLATWIGLPVLLIVMARRRWLCRWLCPVGLCTEYAARWSPMSAARARRIPSIGKWLVALTVGGACLGYPLLVCLDPIAMFCGVFSLGREPLWAGAGVSVAALLTIIVITVVLPGSWCLRLCPLGAMQELLALPARRLHRRRAEQAPSTEHKEPVSVAPARRSVLAMGVGALWAGAGVALGYRARGRSGSGTAPKLRPPGAVDDWQFHQLCLRCGNCARACPAEIIRPDWRADPVAGWLTPRIRFEQDYCREDCDACMQVCPSGAIPRRSLGEKAGAPIGLARVDMSRCLLALDRECRTMCVGACPYDAIRIHKWTWDDDRCYPVIDADKCPGCGACVLACRPMDALTVV